MTKRLRRVRLSDHDLDALIRVFQEHFLNQDQLWLFGSRADLTKKGGDIDLYVETYAQTIKEAYARKEAFLSNLEKEIGEQKIDVVLHQILRPHPLLIHDIAKTTGIQIV